MLYQDQVIISNRSNTSKKVSFEIPAPVSDFIQIFPASGYVQPGSILKAQLRFEPTAFLMDESPFFSTETGLFEVSLKLVVMDQVKMIDFTLSSILTSNELILSTENIDFGTCTVHERVISKLVVGTSF